MRLTLAALADFTSITQEGKLNILGIFDIIYAERFPVAHRDMQLVLRFEFSATDANEKQTCVIILMDEDGNRLLNIRGDVIPPMPPPGQFAVANVIFNLRGLPLKKPGSYEFSIYIGENEEPEETIRLNVAQLSPNS